MKTCLITGARGFLGARIASEFVGGGYRVAGLGREVVLPDQIAALGLASYRTAELSGPALSEMLAAEQPDVVVHAAGPASVTDSVGDPALDFQGTVGVTFEVLEAVRRSAPRARVVTLSSAAVYGNPAVLPVSECAAIAPVSPYGFHKHIAETLLHEFHQLHGISACAARIFSAYGSGLRRQVLWDVCEKAGAGSVGLFGTGEETRDFIHADDVARAVRVLAENAPMRGEAHNVASGVETSIRELAEQVVALVSPDAPVVFSGVSRAGDPLRWRADISSIRALGFEPHVPLADGVAEYCQWYLRAKRMDG